jgi:hypothetical protein
MKQRAKRADRAAFRNILAKVPDRAPWPNERAKNAPADGTAAAREVLPSMCPRLKIGRMILNITLPMKRIVSLRF